MNLRSPLVILGWKVCITLAAISAVSPNAADGAVPKTPDEKVIEALSQKSDFDYRTTPLLAVAEHIGTFHQIVVNLVPEVKKRDFVITFKAKQIKLADALKAMLEPHGLEYAVASGTV